MNYGRPVAVRSIFFLFKIMIEALETHYERTLLALIFFIIFFFDIILEPTGLWVDIPIVVTRILYQLAYFIAL